MDFLTIDFYFETTHSMQEIDDFIRAKLNNQNTDSFIENPIKTEKGKWIAESFHLIEPKHCRKCKEELKPYKEVYERYFWSGDLYKKYSYKNGYCQKCAKEKQGDDNLWKYTKQNYIGEEKNGSGIVMLWKDFEVRSYDATKASLGDPECYKYNNPYANGEY